jgi:hypothetical protein
MKDEVVENMWHVYSDGTRADIPFNTDEDKLYAWNSVAVCAEIAGVQVWVLTVNDTHLHTVVKGLEVRVKRFRDVLQQRLQTRFPGQGIYFACDPIKTHDDVLIKFMYVYRNCLDFFMNLPGEYAWGSGNIYFSRNVISSRDEGSGTCRCGNSAVCSTQKSPSQPIGCAIMTEGFFRNPS